MDVNTIFGIQFDIQFLLDTLWKLWELFASLKLCSEIFSLRMRQMLRLFETVDYWHKQWNSPQYVPFVKLTLFWNFVSIINLVKSMYKTIDHLPKKVVGKKKWVDILVRHRGLLLQLKFIGIFHNYYCNLLVTLSERNHGQFSHKNNKFISIIIIWRNMSFFFFFSFFCLNSQGYLGR